MTAPHIKRNSQAVRWCKTNKMTASFWNWKEYYTKPMSDNIPEGITCKLSYTLFVLPAAHHTVCDVSMSIFLMNREVNDYRTVFGKNLIDCVNEAIRLRMEKEL